MPYKEITINGHEVTGVQFCDGYQDIAFGQVAKKSSIRACRSGGTGLTSIVSVSSYTGEKTETDGTVTCVGVKLYYQIYVYQAQTFTPSFSGLPVTTYVYTPSTCIAKVEWETYTVPAAQPQVQIIEEGDPVPTPPEPPKTEIEWIEQQVVRQEGLNVKCIDTYHKTDLLYGEIRADENITNALIPNEDIAKKIGELAILKTSRNLNVDISTPPNFDLKPLKFIANDISFLGLTGIRKIDSINFKISATTNETILSYQAKEE